MLKNSIRQYKGVTSILFVFIFLYSSSFRGYTTSEVVQAQPTQKNKFAHEKANFSSLENKISGLSFIEQLQKDESESNEIDLDISIGIYFRSIIINSKVFSDFYQSQDTNFLKIPLYDMFCKWKFHLS